MYAKCFAKYTNDAKGLVKTGSGLNSVITLDDNNRVSLVAIRDIRTGEELFFSYSKSYWRKSAGYKK
jgi:uncharacterized protein